MAGPGSVTRGMTTGTFQPVQRKLPLEVHLLAMKRTVAILSMLFCLERAQAQVPDTFALRKAVSNRDTIVYTRIIRLAGC